MVEKATLELVRVFVEVGVMDGDKDGVGVADDPARVKLVFVLCLET